MSFGVTTEEYYKRFIELQEKLRKSEEERLKLEIKFNDMLRTTREEEQKYYRKLRTHYKRFLEEDRRCRDRNENIVRSLENIDTRINAIVAKAERFKLLRHQYQTFSRQIINKKELSPGRYNDNKPLSSGDTKDIVENYLQNLSSTQLRGILKREEIARARLAMFEKPTENNYPYTNLYGDVKPNFADDIQASNYSKNIVANERNNEKDYVKTTPELKTAAQSESSEPDDTVTDDFSEAEEIYKNPSQSKTNFNEIKDENPAKLLNLSRTSDAPKKISTDETPMQNTKMDFPVTKMQPQEAIEKEIREKPIEEEIPEKATFTKCEDEEKLDDVKVTETKIIQPDILDKISIKSEEDVQQMVDTKPNDEQIPSTSEQKSDAAELDVQKSINPISTEPIQPYPQEYQYFDENGQPILQYDENGQPVDYYQEYDQNEPLDNYNQHYIDQSGQQFKSPQVYDENNEKYDQNQQLDQTNEVINQQHDETSQLLNQQYDETSQLLNQQYDERNQLINQQYDETGQLTNPQYDESGQLLNEQYDETGQLINSQYDETGQLLNPQYDETGQLLNQQFDETGQLLNEQYDETGQLINSQYDETGQLLNPLYDQTGQLLNQQYDETGQLINPQYDETGQLLNPLYDQTGQLLNQQYDETGQLLNQQYDETGQLITPQYDETGHLLNPQYDETGQLINHQYDESGQVLNQQYEYQQSHYDESGQLNKTDQQYNFEHFKENVQRDEQENISVAEENILKEQEVADNPKAASKVMEMLDTDTESMKQDTKVSQDSDFDFSNS